MCMCMKVNIRAVMFNSTLVGLGWVRLLKALCVLPVAYPDKLKAIIYCIEKEGLILESDVTDSIVEVT